MTDRWLPAFHLPRRIEQRVVPLVSTDSVKGQQRILQEAFEAGFTTIEHITPIIPTTENGKRGAAVYVTLRRSKKKTDIIVVPLFPYEDAEDHRKKLDAAYQGKAPDVNATFPALATTDGVKFKDREVIQVYYQIMAFPFIDTLANSEEP